MFLLNSRLGLFSAASLEAPLLPKLRGHFAEFLNKGSPVRLRIFFSSTCVGLRYGHLQPYLATFLASVDSLTSLLFSLPISTITYVCVLHYIPLPYLGHAFPSACFNYPSVSLLHLNDFRWYWNIYQLSIIYAFRPRLRSRLTLGGRTFPRNP